MSPGQRITLVDAPGSPAERQSAGAAARAPFSLDEIFDDVGGSIASVRGEIDDALADLKTCYRIEPDEAMALAAGHSARLAELRIGISRIEDFHRQWVPIRTREVEPAIAECHKQFEMASRRLSAREISWRIETGAR